MRFATWNVARGGSVAAWDQVRPGRGWSLARLASWHQTLGTAPKTSDERHRSRYGSHLDAPVTQQAFIRRRIVVWERTWNAPGLAGAVSVRFSSRLRRSWGRASPQRGQVALHAGLAASPAKFLEEVLCHEVAHVAVFLVHGRRARPHGVEWKQLVNQAGFSPTLRSRGLPTRPEARSRSSSQFEHRCLVCQTRRIARRRMQGWRCAICVAQGLPGYLDVRRLAGRALSR